MILHVFNPEHDIALAYNDPYFTAPRAGRQMRICLEWLPLLWANDGDLILTHEPIDNKDYIYPNIPNLPRCQFVTYKQLNHWKNGITCIDAWGWDSAIRHEFIKNNIPSQLLPTDEQLTHIRSLSHRRYAMQTLKELRDDYSLNSFKETCELEGKASEIHSLPDFISYTKSMNRFVLKSPWSSSGRGVRLITHGVDFALEKWARGVIRLQGAIMIEPLYEKVIDFGAEFISCNDKVKFVGLSIFQTLKGTYEGNLLESEHQKETFLSQWISIDFLHAIIQKLCLILSRDVAQWYEGCIGVDMMIVNTGEHTALHPCVEINLRRTMGHVAIALYDRCKDLYKSMRIDHIEGKYRLTLNTKAQST